MKCIYINKPSESLSLQPVTKKRRVQMRAWALLLAHETMQHLVPWLSSNSEFSRAN